LRRFFAIGSRFTAAQAGFFILNQSGERPEGAAQRRLAQALGAAAAIAAMPPRAGDRHAGGRRSNRTGHRHAAV
jgi:hypothetical protein